MRARSAALLVVLSLGCSEVDSAKREPVVGPDRATFTPVAGWLAHRCGSLDCHGTRYRNLRIWGQDGMRLAIGDTPGGAPTTTPEEDATYESVVELEPELMREVVNDHGARPERLTLIRKARGLEKHTGGTIVNAGDARDRCLTSWLAGATDDTACRDALALP